MWCMVGLVFRNIILIIQKAFKQMSYPYVMMYTCKEAWFTLSVIIHAKISTEIILIHVK